MAPVGMVTVTPPTLLPIAKTSPSILAVTDTAECTEEELTNLTYGAGVSDSEHAARLSLVYPASHAQAVAAAGELECAGQLTHVAFPVPGLYVPATHAVH